MKQSHKKTDAWESIRKDGKTHYAITRGVFAFGFPLMICLVGYRILFQNQGLYGFLGELCAIIPGSIIAGYGFGRHMWEVREKIYVANLASNTSAENDQQATDVLREVQSSNEMFYIHLQEQVKGPFSLEQLKALQDMQTISANTPCCYAGADKWQTVADCISPH